MASNKADKGDKGQSKAGDRARNESNAANRADKAVGKETRDQSRDRENRDRERDKERERAKERDRIRERNQKEKSDAGRAADKSKDLAGKAKETRARTEPPGAGKRDVAGAKRQSEAGKQASGTQGKEQQRTVSTHGKTERKARCDDFAKRVSADPKGALPADAVKDLAADLNAKNISVVKDVNKSNGKTIVEVRISYESKDGELVDYASRWDLSKPEGFRSTERGWNELSLNPNPEFSGSAPAPKSTQPNPQKNTVTPSPRPRTPDAKSSPKASRPSGKSAGSRPEKHASGRPEKGIWNPNRAELPDAARKVLEDIMKRAGLSSLTVTRTSTTAAKQARIMHRNIKQKSVKASYKLYSATGDKVVKVYEDNSSLSDKALIAKMEAKIEELGLKNVTHHGDPSRYVIDIDPNSIADKKAFVRAVKETKELDQDRFLPPPKDPAYHIEIPKSKLREVNAD